MNRALSQHLSSTFQLSLKHSVCVPVPVSAGTWYNRVDYISAVYSENKVNRMSIGGNNIVSVVQEEYSVEISGQK